LGSEWSSIEFRQLDSRQIRHLWLSSQFVATDPEQQQQQQPLQPWESHSHWKITAPSRRVSIDFISTIL